MFSFRKVWLWRTSALAGQKNAFRQIYSQPRDIGRLDSNWLFYARLFVLLEGETGARTDRKRRVFSVEELDTKIILQNLHCIHTYVHPSPLLHEPTRELRIMTGTDETENSLAR